MHLINEYPLQYYIYDQNSFIADVGGYLGLLLGQSIYGIYEVLSAVFHKTATYLKPKMNKMAQVT